MASEFTPLNEKDTKELRKELGLPVTKSLIYWQRENVCAWKQLLVVDYEVIAVYEPSGSKSIRITLENGSTERILGDYFAEMQKPSFLSDIGEEEQKPVCVIGKTGNRIESNTDTYVVVDLETTGRNHYKDEITEIGAIRYEAGKETERFEVLLKTEVTIPPAVEKKTGISNDMLRLLGTEPKEALEAFRDFLGDSVVVGHNFTSFDSYFLEDAYVKQLNCHFSNDYIDTLYLSRKVFPQFKHHSLEYLSQEYEIDYSKAHRALEDCEINHKVYEYLTFGYLLCDESGETALETDPETLVESEALEEWQVKLASKFAELENEFALWKGSFSIMENKRKGGKISSYAICVYEPDLVEERKDSSRNTILARVREDVLKSNANIVEVYSKSFGQTDEKKRFEKDSDELIDCLVGCIRSGIQNYVPKADVFACCSRYEECSNAGKCIHPNGLYAKACQYRKNLEEGNVFY